MFNFEKTDNGYMAHIVERIVVERNKEVDSAILGEIKKIAIDNEIETKIILNEKNVAEALRNYQERYKTIKAEVARKIFAEIEDVMNNIGYFDEIDFNSLKKKYMEE